MNGKSNKPMVSVIMPTYNCGQYIEESIQSVLAQTMDDWEIQIVDDCSGDNTHDLILPYIHKDSRIHYHCLTQKSGASPARTEAIKYAKGKFIAFLDSDDLWNPEKLEKQIRFMEKDHILFSATGYEQIDECGNSKGLTLMPPVQVDYWNMIRFSDPIGNLTVMYDQEVLGKYEVPDIEKRNDFALWLRILHDVDYCWGLQENLAKYRIHKGSLSYNKLNLVKYHWRLYHDIEKIGLTSSLWGIARWALVKGTGIGLEKRRSE